MRNNIGTWSQFYLTYDINIKSKPWVTSHCRNVAVAMKVHLVLL